MTRVETPLRRATQRLRTSLVLIVTVGIALGATRQLEAGGPLLFADDGSPMTWDAQVPLVLRPGTERLGAIASPVDLLRRAVSEWNAVSTSSLTLEIGDELPASYEDLSAAEFQRVTRRNDRIHPVIFDADGSIFRELFGAHSGVLAIAGPSLVLPATGEIVKGFALFNGAAAADPDEEEGLTAMFTHEVGHLIGLDHTQINGLHLGEEVPGYDAMVSLDAVPTMYPVLLERKARPHPMAVLHKDDRASLSALYPTSQFSRITAAITGFVFDFDGITQLQGVNVIARNVEDPLHDAVSYVSGQRAHHDNDFEPRSLRGFYELRGLTPGARYELTLEEVASRFTGGSGVGPLDPPNDLDPSESKAFLEFWNGSSEAGANPPDDPLHAEAIRLRSGETRQRVDFVFNGVLPRVSSVMPSSGDYTSSHTLIIRGTNLGSFVKAQLAGPMSIRLDATPVSPTRVDAIVPAFVLPGDYRLVITTAKGAAGTESGAYEVTESPPVIEFFTPNLVRNNRATPITVSGVHLLGTRSIRLVATGQPDVELENLSVSISETESAAGAPAEGMDFSFYVAIGDVPRGALPGSYRVVLTNTAGSTPESAGQLDVVELAPLVFGSAEPSRFNNSRAVDIRISGRNLAGTSSVRLEGEDGEFELTVRSTSLNDVLATVPARLPPGIYTVVLTNSVGTATSTSEVTITKKSGGGGGGCSLVVAPGSSDPPHDFTLLILVLVSLMAIIFRNARPALTLGRASTPT